MNKILLLSEDKLIGKLWSSEPKIKKILRASRNLSAARDHLFEYLNNLERDYFNSESGLTLKNKHLIEKNNAKECINVLKNIIRTENERLTGFSALNALRKIAKKEFDSCNLSKGFLCEFIFLFRGINGKAFMYLSKPEYLENEENRDIAINRSKKLDEYSLMMAEYMRKYSCGLFSGAIKKRTGLKREILRYFNATEQNWKNYQWHLKHIIVDVKTLSQLIKLEKDELEGLEFAEKNNIPFQITPHYLSLFNKTGRTDGDRAIRAQVIPSIRYCRNVIENRANKSDMDFMGEKSTSPIDCITRRYAQIVILKPFESCPQICVYCQRNWEIKSIHETKITKHKIIKAINWLKKNKNITEVLITGGDPLTLPNNYLDWLLKKLSRIAHIERIRIGTRVLVTLPSRIDNGLIKILKKHHKLGVKELCIVTHFEHASEITPDSLKAIEKIKKLGINIYNQQVFTYYNSRKYETCFLRKKLKLSGIDPYYSFNTKGKEETIDFRVPIARIAQERKEEARMLPGIIRTDEPVFNVPKLGKSHLRSWQDHEIIMVLPNGCRVYRFYPWESKILLTETYQYADVSIYDYLARLSAEGEETDAYKSIWYYF